MPAVLLARKIARNQLAVRGVHPCMGFLKLEEFEPEFARLRIRSAVEEYDA